MGISGHPKKKEKKEWLANIKQSDIDLIDKVIITQKNPIKESNVNILDSIKSFYITKNIFSYLKKKKILQILKYNKKYQNKFEYNLDDYKNNAGKRITIDNNGIIKLYSLYNNKLLFFEGIYLRGRKIKYGREYYYDGDLKYEGYYLYEKKCGKGKEYINNYLIYSGEYKNDKKNGKGQEYDKKGRIIFEGEYLNGIKWNGFGYDGNGNIVYELKEGKGIIQEFFDNGILSFKGEYSNGKKNGEGKQYNDKGMLIFQGQYLNGKIWNGKVNVYNEYTDKLEYIKEYLYGKIQK